MPRRARSSPRARCSAGARCGGDDEAERTPDRRGHDARRGLRRRDAGAERPFDPQRVYEREAPGVVTVFSVFGGGGVLDREPEQEGAGSGFVLDGDGEIATNAHVVTERPGRRPEAREGGLRRSSPTATRSTRRSSASTPTPTSPSCGSTPRGLTLRPLPLGSSRALKVGAPVVAIGSPYGEPQSLSVGVISGLDRVDRVAHRLLHRRRDPDRRRDQPRQLRRPARRRAGPGARDQLADPLDGRRRRGRRLRRPGRHRPPRADVAARATARSTTRSSACRARRSTRSSPSASTCPSTRAPGCRT